MPDLGYWGATKPSPGTQLNRGHPLATTLVGAWPLNEGAGAHTFDVARNILSYVDEQPTYEAQGRWVGGDHGAAIRLLAAQGTHHTVNLDNAKSGDAVAKAPYGTPPFTWTVRFRGALQAGYLLSLGVDGGGGALVTKSDGTIHVHSWGGNDGGDVAFPYANGAFHTLSLVVVPSDPFPTHNAYQLYGDGYLLPTTGDFTAIPAFDLAAGVGFFLGGQRDGGFGPVSPWYGDWDYAYAHGQALTAPMIANLHARPFDMFAPPVWRRYFVPAAVVTAYVPYDPWPQLAPILTQ